MYSVPCTLQAGDSIRAGERRSRHAEVELENELAMSLEDSRTIDGRRRTDKNTAARRSQVGLGQPSAFGQAWFLPCLSVSL